MTIYLEHFGFREAPFRITPHTEFFFAGANRGETLEALIYAITSGEGIVKVVGEVGSGKTMLCRVLMERLPETVETIYLVVPSLSRDEMLAVVAGDLGIDTQGSNTTKVIRALQTKLIEIHEQGKQVVALIDEAHAMPMETLEEIRLLSNLETSQHKLMQIVLFGQPELDQHLAQPHMRQLKERITHSFNLLPLPARDIKDYLGFRLRAAGYKGPDLFSKEALALIAEASEGLTRRINIYADKTLLAAYAEGTHTITADHARAAINDTQIVAPATSKGSRSEKWVYAALGFVLGTVLGFLLAQNWPAPTPTATVTIKPEPNKSAAPQAPADAAQPAASAAASVTANAPAAPASSAAPATDAPAAEPKAAKPEAAAEAPAAQDWLSRRVAADATKLASPPAERWTIQLMIADQAERNAIESFLADAGRQLGAESVLVYAAGTGDKARVGVIFGEFGSRREAQAELTRLPARLSQFRPYARSFQAIREDIRVRQGN
ncbi:MAG: AAA family ATPase [Burkholderiales bacterium]|nr:AAA family ATPase [Burkholderiales bacterium]